MTEQEAIERIYSKLMDGTPKDKDACDIAIDAFEKSHHYRAMERRLKAVYGDCDNLLETVVEGFCRHSGADIGTPVKSRLLTDEDVDKWDAYRAIGTVEECREAREKQMPKAPKDSLKIEPVIDENGAYVDADTTVYILCPNCGELVGMDEDIDRFCRECGQAIQWNENTEENI